MTEAIQVQDDDVKVAALIGWPVAQSLSPAIHNAAFKSHGDRWIFVSFPVEPGDAETAITAMRSGGISALSVTMPHKDAVANLVDELDESAKLINAVNCVVRTDDGKLIGYSTDGQGIIRSIENHTSWNVSGKKIVVLGAGGAARAAVAAFSNAGASEIVVVNRTEKNARSAALISSVGRVGAPNDVLGCDIVFNGTSVGMGSNESPVDSALLHSGQLVIDAVYHPIETQLLKDAKAAGAETLDGLWMLIHQACVAQSLWIGREPDYQVMRVAAERELKARGN